MVIQDVGEGGNVAECELAEGPKRNIVVFQQASTLSVLG